MKRPWQIWMLFFVSVALAFLAMVWLSANAMESGVRERQALADAKLARRQSELQEIVSSALWRMDGMLAPFVAQETSRPYFVYQPFCEIADTGTSKGKVSVAPSVPSPLLVKPPKYVLLHFQIANNGQWTSPQRPVGTDEQRALACGLKSDQFDAACDRLETLESSINVGELGASLPDSLVPQLDLQAQPWNANGMYANVQIGSDNEPDLGGYGQNIDMGAQQQSTQQLTSNAPATGRGGRSVSRRGTPQQTDEALPQQAINPQMRGDAAFQQRSRVTQDYAINHRLQNQFNAAAMNPGHDLGRESATQSMWIDDKLILARRVVNGDEKIIQGCWLDWEQLERVLMEEIVDILPEASLAKTLPDAEVKQGCRLATLPVHLVIDEPTLADVEGVDFGQPSSAITVSLILAWSCLLLTTGAVAVLLQGVVKLSERRGAFVSAVTHELRTPLTTFRMYAEMLAQNMVPDPEKRQQYLETLRVEADRLAHLVENVLQYARLERGRPGQNRADVVVSSLIDRVVPRLTDRAKQADMDLSVDSTTAEGITISTDAVAVEQILFNLVDNACKYAIGAEQRRIELQCDIDSKRVHFRVRDFGPGIDQKEAATLFRPFSKSVDQAANSAPGVGLGLALCKRLANDLGGRLELECPAGGGAEFILTLPKG